MAAPTLTPTHGAWIRELTTIIAEKMPPVAGIHVSTIRRSLAPVQGADQLNVIIELRTVFRGESGKYPLLREKQSWLADAPEAARNHATIRRDAREHLRDALQILELDQPHDVERLALRERITQAVELLERLERES